MRIAFRLHDPAGAPRPDRFLSVGAFVCKDRAALPPALGPSREGRLFDFTTTISTDLNILFMGDSLAHQFSQGFDAAVVPEDRDDRRKVHLKYVTGKQFDCLVSTAPVRGGGATAFWRYTKLIERGRRAPLVPCYMFERWWGENFLQTLLNLEYDPTPETGQRQGSVAGWDAVVLRVPHGWMKAEELTRERIHEAILFCQEVIGARVVIITTVGLDNNAITSELWEKVTKINDIIHDVAMSWEPLSGDNGVKFVLVQEFSNFTSQILHENGRHLGYDVSTEAFFFERLLNGTTSWAQSIPMVCSNRPKDNLDAECERNTISPDGIHWCVETLGPRFSASLACLLGCVFNGEPLGKDPRDLARMRQCERECNERFMSLARVKERLVEQGRTLFASAQADRLWQELNLRN